VHDDEVVNVRSGLVCLYGAVAAVLRGDAAGRDLLLADLREAFGRTDDALIAISLATLERLEAAVVCRPITGDGGGQPIAQEILRVATEYGISHVDTVRAGASRLDAVRQGDRARAADEVREATRCASDHELVLGATAVLAATVAVWARRSGRSPRHLATELCLAASSEVWCR